MAKKGRTAAHNGVTQFTSKFQHPFTVDESFIDCKEMSRNYAHGLIPFKDLAEAVNAVHGSWQGRVNQYNSQTPTGKVLKMFNLTPSFKMVKVDKVYSHPSFNRDTSPNHCLKLEEDWFDQFAVCGLGLIMPEVYGGGVYNADVTHTGINRIRKGDTELPYWVAEVPDQGTFEDTHELALFIAGHLFLAINVRNKRGVDIFDQHFIKVACGIYPAPQIQNIINTVPEVSIKRAGNKIAYAIHNLNEVQNTFELDQHSIQPGQLLKDSLNWLVRNFKHQSIDGCLMTSFALVLKENRDAGINWTLAEEDTLATLLKTKYNTANSAQLKIKEAYIYWNNPNYAKLDPNYLVSNGLKHLARSINLNVARDDVRQWDSNF